MTLLEMVVNPFQWQCILAFNANGQVIFTVVSEVLNKQILLINIHYKISFLPIIIMINYFQSRPSSYTPSNAYSTCPIVRMLSDIEDK